MLGDAFRDTDDKRNFGGNGLLNARSSEWGAVDLCSLLAAACLG